jgi:hypothetical protein
MVNQKRKKEKIGKEEKAVGERFGPAPDLAHGPSRDELERVSAQPSTR